MTVLSLLHSSSSVLSMVKPPNPASRQIFVTLPAGARALFNQLVARKLYGGENGTVARHLILIGLDHLVAQGRLVDAPLSAAPPDDEAEAEADETIG